MIRNIIRFVIMLSFAAGGTWLSNFLSDFWSVEMPAKIQWAVVGLSTIVLGLIGYALAPSIIKGVIKITGWFEEKLQKVPTQDIFGGVIGIIIGLIIANLLGASFYRLPIIGPYLPMVGSLILGYLGWSLGTKRKEELVSAVNIFKHIKDRDKDKDKERLSKIPSQKENYKVLDTSVIIDGRIADICKSGFIDGTLIIPGFVLEELRHIADSSDLLKRNRGRRGLDILNKIRKELDVKVDIIEKDYEDIEEVDSKLVRMAQELDGKIITNDFNLNKVAELQEVEVLNINELANAVKPVVLPGEEMSVKVIKEGKETGQGVGYLDDGTMIVVENGKKFINQTITVVVTSVLQTAAGRMIFAKPNYSDKKQSSKESFKEVNAGASNS